MGDRPHLPRIPALDGLRALAVASVFLYHADAAWASGGFLGVDVFFVISGYLITALLLVEWRRHEWLDVAQFWKRRALRLLPALLTLLVGVWAVVPWLAPEQGGRLQGDVWGALLYVSNWRSIFQHQSYFEAVGRPPLLQHLWSLAVEEQFYLVWPLVLWVGLGVKRRAGRLFVWIVAGALGSAALMAVLYTPGTDPSRVYYGTDTRVAAILLGAAVACVWTPWRWRRNPRVLGKAVLGAAGLGSLGGLAWCVTNLHQFDDVLYRGGFLGVAALAAVLVAALAHPATPLVPRLLAWPPLVWLGRRSYGIYLFYWPVLLLTRAHYDVPLAGNALLALRAGITVALAAVSYRCIETPVRNGALGRLWADLRRTAEGRARPSRRWVGLRALTVGAALAAVVTVAVVARPAVPSTTLLASLPVSPPVLPAEPLIPATSTSTSTTPVASTTTSTVVDVTTTTTTEAPAPTTTTQLPKAHVTGLGDSVLLEAKATLEARLPDAAIDAVVGRQFKELLAEAKLLRDTGRLGDEVILQMGNNGPVTGSQFDDIMDVLKSAKRVVVVNVKVPRPWEPTNNEMLAAAVGRWPTAGLVDWHKHGAAHPELFADDGTHMGPTGVTIYVDLIIAAL